MWFDAEYFIHKIVCGRWLEGRPVLLLWFEVAAPEAFFLLLTGKNVNVCLLVVGLAF